MIPCLKIATRESPLALAQTHKVQQLLVSAYPDLESQLVGITTEADRRLDLSLSKIGGKGLFIKALEQALLEEKADIAVHSLKDLPTDLSDDFCVAAVLKRDSPFDAFVSNKFEGIEQLPPGAIVGTSSLRRASQLQYHFPHIVIQPLRGNIGTRLKKLDDNVYDAIILAEAGLQRLNLGHRICQVLSPVIMLPAIGQGAIAIECLTIKQALKQSLNILNDLETYACISAERAFCHRLQGDCHMPIAAYAKVNQGSITLTARIIHVATHQLLETTQIGSLNQTDLIGIQAANKLIELGAHDILAEINHS